MAKPRPGFTGRFIEFPDEVWAMLDSLRDGSGVGVQVLLEDAARRYCAKPPKSLPEPRKKGRPKKAEAE